MINPVMFSIELYASSLDLVEEFLEDRMDEFLDELAEEAEMIWRKFAEESTKLQSSKKTYIDAIKVQRDGSSISMTLDDPHAADLEDGSTPFDLKPGFLRGKQYRVIPLVNNGVTTFKTLVAGAPGWIHPGQEARNLTDDVTSELSENSIGEIFARVINRTSI